MNLVRQSVSRLKGGGVLNFAYPAKVQSYILSDVLGDDLSVVGSGPSMYLHRDLLLMREDY